MTGGGGEDFQVQPDDLRKAGDGATQTGEHMADDTGEVAASAKTVSGALDGFALAGSLGTCATAWEDKLESLAHEVSGAGRRLRANADNYDKVDAAGRVGFDSAGGALVPPGG